MVWFFATMYIHVFICKMWALYAFPVCIFSFIHLCPSLRFQFAHIHLHTPFLTQDLFFLFPCNSFLHSTCECLIRLIVLRAILNITCSQSSPDPSPSNTVSFNSTDAFHQQFFTSNECSPKSGGFFRLNEYAIVR